MPPKSTRVRKPANKEPTSLATRTTTSITPSSPDQLPHVIDPQLFALNRDAITLNNNTIDDSIVVERDFSPFSDGFPNLPSRPSTPDVTGTINDSQPLDTEPDSQQEQEQTQQARNTTAVFAWTFAMEEALFNELIHQDELGKRADSGFKKEAWTAVLAEVYKRTTQKLTVERCKNKVDIMRTYWRGFNYLKNQSGFGFNEKTGLIEASDEVWKELLKVS
jgi:Myb/SANT-like DNA-binding domain